jgi:thymidylate kinase
MTKRGQLIVLEGPDGSGKSTLSRFLAEHLKNRNIECQYFAFPGLTDGTLGKLVHDLHHSPISAGVTSITPTSLQLLHIAAHVDAIESRIIPALKNGKTVILDRFWWSTWVYGKVTRVSENILRSMIRSERIAWGKVRPTRVFLVSRRLSNRTQNYEQLFAEYMKLGIRETRSTHIRYIENESTVTDVLSKILSDLNVDDQGSTSNGPIPKCNDSSQKQSLFDDKERVSAPTCFSRIAPAVPTIVFETYWQFAAKRQEIFFRRLSGDRQPWTDDPVLMEYKFTNVYRASDRVSQYLIRHVIYQGDPSPEEVFFRILLFKFFNKIETWKLLTNELGTLSASDYSFERYDAVLSRAIDQGVRIYSAAYIMPSAGASKANSRKHQMHLKLLEQMIRDGLHLRISDSPSMKDAFELLRSYQTIGNFLAYQYVTDLNYSTLINFSEMDFVVPGPGARDGIRKCFRDLGGLNESEIIKLVADRQEIEFEYLGLKFQSLWGRPLQLIDCQNIFCEVDKYARINHPEISGITGRTRIKQKYRSSQSSFSVWYPPKWGLNEKIASEDRYVPSF